MKGKWEVIKEHPCFGSNMEYIIARKLDVERPFEKGNIEYYGSYTTNKEACEERAAILNKAEIFTEDKEFICALLLKTLQATENAHDVVSITYERTCNCDEVVTVKFESGGYRKINVSMDSGTAMIRDIMKGLGC